MPSLPALQTPADAPLPSSITWGEPSTFGGASWAITNNGLTVEFDFTPKDTCGDGDPQGGQVRGTLATQAFFCRHLPSGWHGFLPGCSLPPLLSRGLLPLQATGTLTNTGSVPLLLDFVIR